MGLFSGLFRSRDKPQNRTTGSSYAFFMGGSTAGKAVNERSAMQMTAVYACVRILSEAIAGLPLHLYEYGCDGSKEKAVEHPLYFLLHDEPNKEMTSFVFRETLMTHLLLWGNAYAQVIRNGKGEVIALYPLMPNRMEVNRTDKGQLYYQYTTSSDDAPTVEGSTAVLMPEDVLHIPGLGFDGLVGYSPIAMAKNAIGLAIATEEYGAKFFANGAAPSGVLEHPGTIKDPQRVRDAWMSQFSGSRNAGKVAVLEEGMKYTPISIAWATVRRLQKDDTTMHRGCSPLNWFICRSRPKPSRPGSTTSVTSSCGRSRFTMSKATSPLSVLPTTRNSPAASICWRSMVRNSSLASANTTVTLFSILSRSFSTQIAQPRLPVSRQSNICRLACI